MTATGAGRKLLTMLTVTPDRDAVAQALAQESGRVVGLVRGCRDLRAPVPGLAWDVGQLAAHLTAVYMVFAQTLREDLPDRAQLEQAVALAEEGSARPATLRATIAAANEYALSQIRFDDAQTAADALAEQAAALRAALADEADFGREVATPWYGLSRTRTAGTIASLAVTESLVHGHDLARAVRADTKMSQRSAAAAAPTVMSAMLPLLLDSARAKGVSAAYEVRLRGGRGFVVRIADGKAECFEPGEHYVDCVISLDPRAALLLGFGRRPLTRVALTGGAMTTGRKPWLGLKFTRMFDTP